jgi:UDP-N-acetylmuramoylalanine--D-glutamate ligase
MVLGFGKSGQAAKKLLERKGMEVVAVDRKGEEGAIREEEASFEKVELMVVSPGIRMDHPLIERGKKEGVEIVGEMELALREVGQRAVGITGTNGKTTTTLLTTHLLNEAGVKAEAVGNIGKPLSEAVLEGKEGVLVIEMSSFQLETLTTKKLAVGVILNITANHLDWHGSFDRYAEAKLRMGQIAEKLFVSDEVFQSYQIGKRWEGVAGIEERSYTHRLHKQNVEAAFAICKSLGARPHLAALSSFVKPKHRLEWIANVAGVDYVDDSKATSVDAVRHAVEVMGKKRVILLAGGVEKGGSYAPWASWFKGKVEAIFAFGQAGPRIEKEVGESVEVICAAKMVDALEAAKKRAKEGEVILLSPGGASYDEFKSYEHRGEVFQTIVKGWR